MNCPKQLVCLPSWEGNLLTLLAKVLALLPESYVLNILQM